MSRQHYYSYTSFDRRPVMAERLAKIIEAKLVNKRHKTKRYAQAFMDIVFSHFSGERASALSSDLQKAFEATGFKQEAGNLISCIEEIKRKIDGKIHMLKGLAAEAPVKVYVPAFALESMQAVKPGEDFTQTLPLNLSEVIAIWQERTGLISAPVVDGKLKLDYGTPTGKGNYSINFGLFIAKGMAPVENATVTFPVAQRGRKLSYKITAPAPGELLFEKWEKPAEGSNKLLDIALEFCRDFDARKEIVRRVANGSLPFIRTTKRSASAIHVPFVAADFDAVGVIQRLEAYRFRLNRVEAIEAGVEKDAARMAKNLMADSQIKKEVITRQVMLEENNFTSNVRRFHDICKKVFYAHDLPKPLWVAPPENLIFGDLPAYKQSAPYNLIKVHGSRWTHTAGSNGHNDVHSAFTAWKEGYARLEQIYVQYKQVHGKTYESQLNMVTLRPMARLLTAL